MIGHISYWKIPIWHVIIGMANWSLLLMSLERLESVRTAGAAVPRVTRCVQV